MGYNIFWGFLALGVSLWLIAIYYLLRGWGQAIKVPAPEMPRVSLPKIEPPQAPQVKETTEELEIHIEEAPPEETPILLDTDLERFYQRFGRSNVVEFPAEYIDKDHVKGLSGNSISIVEFAKNCYREIDYRCIDSVMVKEKEGRIYRVSIFDLISDHYANSDDEFINFFGRLKEDLAQDIHSINIHPDITPLNKKTLVGRYDALPQLLVWNNKELFLVMVKSKDETLTKRESDFFKEFVIEKRLFKAKIFKVTERKTKREEPAILYREPIPAKTPEEIKKKEMRVAKRPFTKEEMEFLKDNKDKFSNEELARRLNRSLDSVTHKLSRLGIARKTYEWTEVKDKFLRDNISRLSYMELAERLGTTVPSVRARCKKAGIKK